MIEVEWLERPDEAAVEPAAQLISAFDREVIPGEPDTSAAHLVAEAVTTPPHKHVSIGVATEGGQTVGAVLLALEDIAGMKALAEVEYFVVRPDRRRSGIGRALVHAVGERAGRPRIRGYVPTGHAPAKEFARAVGATPGLVDHQNRVRVADLARGMLEGWVRRASERARGYSLVAFDGQCPDDLLEAFTAVRHVMNTAPRTEGDEDELPSPEEVRDSLEAQSRRMGWTWTVCARHDASGVLVGYTHLVATRSRPWLAEQWDTGVDPAHRNRGLGRWLKAINALRLLDERPEVTTVETWNAGVNAAMLSINHAMGFRPVAEWQEWTLERD